VGGTWQGVSEHSTAVSMLGGGVMMKLEQENWGKGTGIQQLTEQKSDGLLEPQADERTQN